MKELVDNCWTWPNGLTWYKCFFCGERFVRGEFISSDQVRLQCEKGCICTIIIEQLQGE